MDEKKFLKMTTERKVLNKNRIRHEILASPKSQAKISFFARRAFVPIMLVLLILTSVTVPATSIYYSTNGLYSSAQATSEYNELHSVIENFNSQNNYQDNFNFNNFWREATSTFSTSGDLTSTDGIEIGTGVSKTNVQTEGLDEGDIVKTDGQYIYKLNDQGCFIVSANNGQLAIASSVLIENYVPRELYIYENKLIMIGGVYERYTAPSVDVEPMLNYLSYVSYNKTDIRVYDITNKQTPVLDRQIVIDGYYNTSRLKLENGKLFYMINYGFSSYDENSYVPKIKDSEINDGQETLIPAENIYFYDDLVSYNYLILGEIDLVTPAENSKLSAFLGLSGTIYVASNNLYVASYDTYSIYNQNILGWVKDVAAKTRIVKIELSTLTQTAIGSVEGNIEDRYWMDEYDNHLRVATVSRINNTTFGGSTTYSNVFVLDSSLNTVGKITNIARDETIYSVRFNKEVGSLVTFELIDPYFNLDLSNPRYPKISKGLKEDGVSHYIHYIGDTNYTIGVGRMSETNGSWVRWTGLKVSLYDNSSGEAVNVNTFIIEGSCHSELFYNPKALLYDEELGLFAFPYQNWTYNVNDWYYGYSHMDQGLAVFSFNVNAELDEDKLVYENTLSNINEFDVTGLGYYNNYNSFIDRGIIIGDYIYTVSHKFVRSYLLADLTDVAILDLYE